MMKTENVSKFAAYAPISSETYAKKKGLPLLNLVGAKTISDKLSDISADNQSISYRYRFIDDHSAGA